MTLSEGTSLTLLTMVLNKNLSSEPVPKYKELRPILYTAFLAYLYSIELPYMKTEIELKRIINYLNMMRLNRKKWSFTLF